MVIFTTLPSGRIRVQIRRGSFYRAASFSKKTEARAWAAEVQALADNAARGGFATPPKTATIGALIEKYEKLRPPGEHHRLAGNMVLAAGEQAHRRHLLPP